MGPEGIFVRLDILLSFDLNLLSFPSARILLHFYHPFALFFSYSFVLQDIDNTDAAGTSTYMLTGS